MKLRFLIPLFLLGGTSAQASVVFSGNCDVLNQPVTSAGVVCREKAGSSLKKILKSTNGYYEVETPVCKGFVPGYCLRKVKTSAKPNSGLTTTTPVRASPSMRGNTSPGGRNISSTSEGTFMGLGLMGNFGVAWGRPSSGAPSTSGNDLGGGLLIAIPLSKKFRITLMPAVQRFSLTRTVDGSGVVQDPNPAAFTQKVTFVGGSLMVGLGFFGDIDLQGRGENWWWDAGVELLTPLSAKQTDNFGSEISFTTQDKLLLLLLGPSGQFALTQVINLNAYLQFFYNLGAQNGSQMLGGRLQLGFEFLL